MMLLTSMLKNRKNTEAIGEPHVFPGMQSGAVLLQSYMTLFQSSPVEIENNIIKLLWKSVKFLYTLITLPSVTLLNMLFPRTAMIKKMSISRMKTLIRESTDITIVFSSACKF